jgi:diguanylate cyclase (GGDEF)-like protein/PAS domain S-box-containing protein
MRTSTEHTTLAPTARQRWGHLVLAALVLVAGVGATATMSVQEQRTATATRIRTFEANAGNVDDQIKLQLSRYADLVASFQALHQAEGAAAANHFAHDLAVRVPERGLAGYQATVVQMGSPRAAAAAHLRSAHVEPHGMSLDVLGLTTAANRAANDEAMRKASRSGDPTITRPLQLAGGRTNLALWVPLFDGQLAAASNVAPAGWVGVVFQAGPFFNETMGGAGSTIGGELIDGTPRFAEPLAVRPPGFVTGAGPLREAAILAPGRLWTVRMQPLQLPARGAGTSGIILVSGLLLTVLLALIVALLGGSKNRAMRLAQHATLDLRTSEQRFRSLAMSSPLGVFSLSAEGSCEYANYRLCELTGRSAQELLGSGLTGIYHPDDRAALRKAVTGDLDRASALRLRLQLADGSLRWVKTHAAPLRDKDDQLTGWVGSVEDVTTEVQAQIAAQQLSVELTRQARHDHLTGLPNRAYFGEQLNDLLAGGQTRVCVLFFDLDRFKVVNDSLGHTAGDRLLQLFAQRIRESVRPEDLTGRFGGDEFVVALLGIDDPEVAVAQAQRLINALNTTMVLDDHELLVSVSMGVALSDGCTDAETLVVHADTAMYRAKARGKARYELYRPALPSVTGESTLEMERQLRVAIESDQLRLLYQPIVSVGTGAIVGVEALVRWEHPERGLLAPVDFVPLAEESGLIVQLGTWVLREACSQLQQWQGLIHDGPQFTMSVNVSARQLADPQFPAVVEAALCDHAVDPAALCLEMTETALLEDLEAVDEVLRALRDVGLRIAVDDFGTGFSSLSHLKLLPVDVIKIDRSFVADLGIDSDTTAIVGAVIRLAGALGLTSVAEGVEELDQLNWLGSLGCDLAQGYLLARPQPASAVASMLRTPQREVAELTAAAAIAVGAEAVTPIGR